MSRTRSLRTRILYWLAAYALLLAAAVSLHGLLVNEYAESLLWDSMLRTEFTQHLKRRSSDPTYHWSDSDSLRLYVGDADALPETRGLPDGIHEIKFANGAEMLALVEHVDGLRHVLTLDITEMEREEDRLTLLILGSSVLLVLGMGAAMAVSLGGALRPLTTLARDIAALSPDRTGQRVVPGPQASSELEVIAAALNDYLQRNEHFVERERAFIRTASHELRTPVAVMSGAAELALAAPEIPAATAHQLRRIRHTADDMDRLIALLLALAKDPARLLQAGHPIELSALLPAIIDDHRHLTRDKALEIVLHAPQPCTILAPPGVVSATVGNLLRNAIEHSDDGRIEIALSADATVVIRDPGHGMSPEQISTIYSRMARSAAPVGDGIGLELIARVCEHLGWALEIDSAPGGGTTATLRMHALGSAR